MPGECAECNGPAEIAEHEWASVELCVPCALELRGRPTQADLAGAEQAAAVARDAEWREAISRLTEFCDSMCWSTSPIADCNDAAPLRALLETKS